VRHLGFSKILVSLINQIFLFVDPLTDLQQGCIAFPRFANLSVDGGNAVQQWDYIDFLPLEIYQGLALHRSSCPILVLVGESIDLSSEARNRGSQFLGLRLKERKLLAVIESEHPVSSVTDTSAVVLLMPGFAVLDLALSGDGSVGAPERLNGIDARVIEALP